MGHALLHHSDRGSQYTSELFQRFMADHGVVCSTSRSANVWKQRRDGELFSSLKTEHTARKLYRTPDEAKADLFDYLERFYNPKRRHSRIGYMSPIQFERASWISLSGYHSNRVKAGYALYTLTSNIALF